MYIKLNTIKRGLMKKFNLGKSCMNSNILSLLKILTCVTLMLQVAISEAFAVGNPRALGGESRIKIMNYMPNTVFQFIGHYDVQSIIEFSIDESIKTISMGTPTPWQIVPAGNRIFLKPVEENATTNMTVITDKRMYFFEMHAQEARSIKDSSISFIVKFVYPENGGISPIKSIKSSRGPDLSKPELYNFKYTVSGDAKYIEPLQIMDDKEFTFFKFRDVNGELPAIFAVDSAGRESLVNFRIQDGYVVVERVTSKFTLRHGADVICVFNEAYNEQLHANVTR